MSRYILYELTHTDIRQHQTEAIMASSVVDDAEQSAIVKDPYNDIATNSQLDMMRVGFAGRIKYQRIYVSLNKNGKKPIDNYDEQQNMPTASTHSITPTVEEEQGRANTAQFLVVGLVNARHEEPPSAGGSDSQGTARVARGSGKITERPNKVLRAVIEVSDAVESQTKYFVAINSTDGLCELRRISQDAVFFFDEFWKDVATSGDRRTRRNALNKTCKAAAARKSDKITGTTKSSNSKIVVDISNDGNDSDGIKLEGDDDVEMDNIQTSPTEMVLTICSVQTARTTTGMRTVTKRATQMLTASRIIRKLANYTSLVLMVRTT